MESKRREDIISKKPKEGYSFIYRYYDSYGSYIGRTKRSLKERGGKSLKGYCHTKTKFSNAILKNGADSFEVEILEEVPTSEEKKKEFEYKKKFDSINNGYNTLGYETWFPRVYDNLDDYEDCNYESITNFNEIFKTMSNEDVYYTCKLIEKLFKISLKDIKGVSLETYDFDVLDCYLRIIDGVYTYATYYYGDMEDAWFNCTGLDLLVHYFEYNWKGKECWKKLYLLKKLDDDYYSHKISCKEWLDKSSRMDWLKDEIANKQEIDDFIVSCDEEYLYEQCFNQAKPICCDCISNTDTTIKYIFKTTDY